MGSVSGREPCKDCSGATSVSRFDTLQETVCGALADLVVAVIVCKCP